LNRQKKSNRGVHLWLWNLAKRDVGFIILLTAAGGLLSLSYILFALLSRQVINAATGGTPVWPQVTLLLGLLAFQGLLNITYNHLSVYIVGRQEIRLRERIFCGLYKKKWQSVSSYHSGDILNRLTDDSTVITGGITGLVPRAVSIFVRLSASVAVLLALDAGFTFVLLTVGILVFIFSRIMGPRMKKMHKAVQQTEGKTRSFMQECVENWAAVQSFGGADTLKPRFAFLQKEHFRQTIRRNHFRNLANTATVMAFSGAYCAALGWGAWQLARGILDFGTMTAFLQIVNQISIPFRNVSGLLPGYYNIVASAERVMELEDLPGEEAAGSLPPVCVLEEIRAENITFAYDKEPVLKEASIVIKAGEFVAFAGLSGIGKSTFLKLLMSFYQPLAGTLTVRLNGEDCPVTAAHRPLFSYVPQGNLILSGTVGQNIAFFEENVPEIKLWEAAQAAELAEFIRSLPAGMNTEIGERGLGLSEGQTQRLAIARALLRAAPVLLLDEATAALDERTEARVLENIRKLPDKTCICVSHRSAALAVCDRVVRIEQMKFD
jgi:ABC-type multidrug transport system fused ATPase/permease subunit